MCIVAPWLPPDSRYSRLASVPPLATLQNVLISQLEPELSPQFTAALIRPHVRNNLLIAQFKMLLRLPQDFTQHSHTAVKADRTLSVDTTRPGAAERMNQPQKLYFTWNYLEEWGAVGKITVISMFSQHPNTKCEDWDWRRESCWFSVFAVTWSV